MREKYIDTSVRCKFYCSEARQKVRCRGVESGNWIHMVWGDNKDKREYKDNYCCADWESCPVAAMLEGK